MLQDCYHADNASPAVSARHQHHGLSLAPGFLIRSTGFSLEQLDALRMPVSDRCCSELRELQTQIDELQAFFTQHLFPGVLEREQQRGAGPPVFRQWYQLNRCIYRQQSCPAELQKQLAANLPEIESWIDSWNTALLDAQAARLVFEQTFEVEFQRIREALHERASDTRFQEALLLSSPNMYSVAIPSYLRHYDSRQRPAKVRHLERRLYSYLQRFCAKNDTTSFFGPIDYGWYDPQADQPLLLEQLPHEPSIAQRLTRLAYWAAQELANLIAADELVHPYLVPRLQDGCALLPSGEIHITITDKRVRLPAELTELLRRIDGQRNVGQICAAAPREQFNRLIERGLVVVRITIPTAVFDPLGWLQGKVAELPDQCASRGRWLEHLAALSQAIAPFSASPTDQKLAILQQLEEQFSALTGISARRGEGAVYVDRLLIYDEAQGDIHTCTIGPSLHADLLARLRPVCDLSASYSLLIQEVCYRRAKDVFVALGGGAAVPYLAFVRQLDLLVRIEDCSDDCSVRSFLESLAELSRMRRHGDLVRLSAADLEPFMRPVPPGTLVSPNIFLAAPDSAALNTGSYQLVIGEVHYGAQIWCHFLTFCDQRDALMAWFAETLPPVTETSTRAGLVHRRQQGKTFYLELPGYSVEMLGRSVKPRSQILPIEDLEVILTRDGLELRSRSGGQRIELYPGDPRSVSNWLFCTPPAVMPSIRLGGYTPQIELDGVVLQRACWKLAPAELLPSQSDSYGSAVMRHANMLRHRYGLPERCFARTPGERKPFYIDFTNVLSLEFFFAMI